MSIEFTQEELQYVVNVLAQRPYSEVAKLLQNIQTQIATPKSDE